MDYIKILKKLHSTIELLQFWLLDQNIGILVYIGRGQGEGRGGRGALTEDFLYIVLPRCLLLVVILFMCLHTYFEIFIFVLGCERRYSSGIKSRWIS